MYRLVPPRPLDGERLGGVAVVLDPDPEGGGAEVADGGAAGLAGAGGVVDVVADEGAGTEADLGVGPCDDGVDAGAADREPVRPLVAGDQHRVDHLRDVVLGGDVLTRPRRLSPGDEVGDRSFAVRNAVGDRLDPREADTPRVRHGDVVAERAADHDRGRGADGDVDPGRQADGAARADVDGREAVAHLRRAPRPRCPCCRGRGFPRSRHPSTSACRRRGWRTSGGRRRTIAVTVRPDPSAEDRQVVAHFARFVAPVHAVTGPELASGRCGPST